MRLLLDTHVWLWLFTSPTQLDSTLRERLFGGVDELLWSTASVWEIAVKHATGRLSLPEPAERFVAARMAVSGATELPVRHRHALRAGALPPHHRDPFDRLLVAQAQTEGLLLVTADARIQQYDVQLLPA